MLDALRAGFRRFAGPGPSESDLGGQIDWAVDRRLGTADYLALPSVARARDLIISTVAQLEPVAYRGGVPMPNQPAIITRPSPGPRYEWLAQVAAGLVDHGDAYLWLPTSGRNAEGWPDTAYVLPNDEVQVSWADPTSRLARSYRWRDRDLTEGYDVRHIALRRLPGELHGHSPFETNADALDRILGTELYAADYFDTGAVPDVTLKYAGPLSDGEADTVKTRWVANHRDHSPGVLPGGWDIASTGIDPERSQLLELRMRGDVEVARLFGIVPAELLLVYVSGSSLTYQNVAAMLDTFVRVTVQPQYLSPIEEALSDLVPRTQVVRFSFDELFRLAEPDRIGTEAAAIAAGIYTLPEVRASHGRPVVPIDPPTVPPALLPTPTPDAQEVPA